MSKTLLWYKDGKFNHLSEVGDYGTIPKAINTKQKKAWSNGFWIFCPCKLINNKVIL